MFISLISSIRCLFPGDILNYFVHLRTLWTSVTLLRWWEINKYSILLFYLLSFLLTKCFVYFSYTCVISYIIIIQFMKLVSMSTDTTFIWWMLVWQFFPIFICLLIIHSVIWGDFTVVGLLNWLISRDWRLIRVVESF